MVNVTISLPGATAATAAAAVSALASQGALNAQLQASGGRVRVFLLSRAASGQCVRVSDAGRPSQLQASGGREWPDRPE